MALDFLDFPDDGTFPSPFSPAELKASIEKEFFDFVPEGKSGAAVAVLTPIGFKVAVAHRIGDDWQLIVQANVDYHGHVDGSIKVLGTW